MGVVVRPRILFLNTRHMAEVGRGREISDLLDPRWKGKTTIAQPLFRHNRRSDWRASSVRSGRRPQPGRVLAATKASGAVAAGWRREIVN